MHALAKSSVFHDRPSTPRPAAVSRGTRPAIGQKDAAAAAPVPSPVALADQAQQPPNSALKILRACVRRRSDSGRACMSLSAEGPRENDRSGPHSACCRVWLCWQEWPSESQNRRSRRRAGRADRAPGSGCGTTHTRTHRTHVAAAAQNVEGTNGAGACWQVLVICSACKNLRWLLLVRSGDVCGWVELRVAFVIGTTTVQPTRTSSQWETGVTGVKYPISNFEATKLLRWSLTICRHAYVYRSRIFQISHDLGTLLIASNRVSHNLESFDVRDILLDSSRTMC